MMPFTRFASFTVARDASFVALAAGLLMLAFSFHLFVAFEIGATVALMFSIGLVVRAFCLTEERIERCEAWLALRDEERPTGEHGRQWARAELEDLLLRFAKSTAGVAGILYGSALVMSIA
jgi:hypothetical protein